MYDITDLIVVEDVLKVYGVGGSLLNGMNAFLINKGMSFYLYIVSDASSLQKCTPKDAHSGRASTSLSPNTPFMLVFYTSCCISNSQP